MKRLLACFAAILAVSATASAQPKVSEKQEIAIFSLGYYGWNIPLEVLGDIDLEVQKVFSDLGRFTITGVTQRLSSGGLEQFIAALKAAKQANFVIPEKYQFNEAVLTEADFNKLLGAFIVATPVVTRFNSYYDSKRIEWITEMTTKITFVDVETGGNVLAIAEVESSGSHKDNQTKSISSAIDGIPNQLQFEIRKIPAFQISTRVLSVSGSEAKLQLGQDMGLKKGDEYSVIVRSVVEGFEDTRETGLIVIKDVGSQVSTGKIVYNAGKLAKDAQLQEIPRLGFDAEPYLHVLMGEELGAVPGLRAVVTRGFYGFRPYGAVQIPLAEISSFFTVSFIPVSGIVGGEFNLSLGRLSLSPF
ncbi:MAG: hypothetical protein Q8M76_15490, partial [Spirochaetaceae bacterium]|nr:hypothetical protein [Spirochaetaceae bacterium]